MCNEVILHVIEFIEMLSGFVQPKIQVFSSTRSAVPARAKPAKKKSKNSLTSVVCSPSACRAVFIAAA